MSTSRRDSRTAAAEGPRARKSSSTAGAVDSVAARPGPEADLWSPSVHPGANAASGTDATEPGDVADRLSLRCPCHTQGATACTNNHTTGPSALEESLWSIGQVAAYLNIPVQTLRTWRKHRTGPPAARIGKHLRYDPAHVRVWVAQQSAEAGDD
jgi:hypothetical protein